MVTEGELRNGLKARIFGSKIYTFDTIDSTNNCARVLANCWAPEGTVVFAEEQTAGRGRLGRPWIANPRENLTFSFIIRPSGSPDTINFLPLCVGIALADVIERTTGLEVVCKWPNDILINGRKTAGILIEGSLKESTIDFVVVGIGLNVNQHIFASELTSKATSLALAAGREFDRVMIFQEFLHTFERHYRKFRSKGFEEVVPLWVSRSHMIGSRIAVSQNGTILTGTVKGLTQHGELLLDHEGEERAFLAGDVTILEPSLTPH